MQLTRNQPYLYGYRGFESLSLRHKPFQSHPACPIKLWIPIGAFVFVHPAPSVEADSKWGVQLGYTSFCLPGTSLAGLRQRRHRFGDAASELALNDLLTMLLEHVGAAFQKQHPEDVFLKLQGIHLAAQISAALNRWRSSCGRISGILRVLKPLVCHSRTRVRLIRRARLPLMTPAVLPRFCSARRTLIHQVL